MGRGGRIANLRLMAASDDFITQLFSSLNPMTKRQPTTNVVCVAYLLTAKDGVLSTDPALVMQTRELDIISHGSVDLRTEKIGYKIREAQLQKVPYMLVVGDREMAEGTVSVRSRAAGDQGARTVEAFLDAALEEVRRKGHEPREP